MDEVTDPEEICKAQTRKDPEEATRRMGHSVEREDSKLKGK